MFSQARELVTAAVEAAEKGDSGGLAPLLDAKMDILAADGFEDVIGMAYLELRHRKNADEAIEVLVSTTRDVREGCTS